MTNRLWILIYPTYRLTSSILGDEGVSLEEEVEFKSDESEREGWIGEFIGRG